MNKKSKTAEKPDELLSKKRGRRVKIAIGRTGKNQKDFALEVLHTSQQHLSCIVTGKHNLTRDNAERIATAADVRVEWLWCEDDFMTTEEIEETVRKAQEKAEWSAFDFRQKFSPSIMRSKRQHFKSWILKQAVQALLFPPKSVCY
mgnify:CR=1 FL=1